MGRTRRFDRLVSTDKQLVTLTQVKRDGGTQPREAMQFGLIDEYAERMRVDDRGFVVDPEGKEWDKLTVFEDDEGSFWLADGFHRVEAALRAGIERFQAQWEQGSQRDAVAYSLQANARHGAKRTNADKRRAVARALRDEEWVRWSDSRLAKMCAVSRPFVTSVRERLEGRGEIERLIELEGADGSWAERQPAPLQAVAGEEPPTDQGQPRDVPASATPAAASPQYAFDKLPDQGPYMRVLAYPVATTDWEVLAARLEDLIGADGLMLCCLGQGRSDLFEGPYLLSARHPARAMRLVYVTDHQRFFMACGARAQDLGDHVDAASVLGDQDPSDVLIVGDALDPWGL